jgi:predicted O-methyltransferase YrrM
MLDLQETLELSLSELSFAFRHPRIALSYLRMAERIAELTTASIGDVRGYSNEVPLSGISERVLQNLRGHERSILGPAKKPRRALAYYIICRIMKPHRVVETGVQSGISTAFLLQALKENSRGVLYSIDLPDQRLIETIPSHVRMDQKSGWVVPSELKKNWVLITGRSQDELPPLLKELKTIDIFIHDSDHSFRNMYQEFETAWPYLTPGGILLSDDIDLNNAFDRFASKNNMHPIRLTHTIGAFRKVNEHRPAVNNP